MESEEATVADSVEQAPSDRRVLASAFASVLAWSFDLYDLFLLLYVAPVIAPLFFPSHIPTLSLAATYASFAVTLLMRPVGSAAFGAFADRRGRKRAMVAAVCGVGIATTLLGLVPTVGAIGLGAPIVFLAIRLLQGFFVGGVVASTHTLATETVSPRLRGVVSGLVGAGGAGLGSIAASVAFFAVSALAPGSAFGAWGWRVMFFTGLISAAVSLFVFARVEESPIWAQQEARQRLQRAPLRTLLSGRRLSVLLVNLLLVAPAGTAYYLTSGYLPTFLKVVNGVTPVAAGVMLIVSSLAIVIAGLVGGQLSQVIGRKRTFLVLGVVDLLALAPVYLWLGALRPAGGLLPIAIAVILLGFLGSALYAPILVFLNERFATPIRATGTALSWNVGFAIGGMMPTFVTLASPRLADITGRLVIFLVVAVLVYIAGALLVPETRGQLE